MIKALATFWLILCAVSVPAAATENRGFLSFGLSGIADWSTQHAFLDEMKSARPWIGHLPNQWGGVSFEEIQGGGHLDAHGWPRSFPEQVTAIETLILTDQPAEARHLAGRYHVLFDGIGRLDVSGRARVIRRSENEIVFDYSPGDGSVGIAIRALDPVNPLRNIRVIHEDHLALVRDGQRFNPLWLDRVSGARTIRFMDWMATNGSELSDPGDLPGVDDFSYAWRGVPLEVMIDAAETIGADPWFTIPHAASDTLVRALAERTRDMLPPSLRAHIEYSNEVWNFIFEQAHFARAQSEALWGEHGDGWIQYYGLRAAQVMDIWTEVFGADADSRLRRVVAVQTGWPGLEEAILSGPLASGTLGRAPALSFDAYAVTGYFGHELGVQETMAATLDETQSTATRLGMEQGLSRVALREYVLGHRFDDAAPVAADIVRNGSLKDLIETLWPYHAGVAADFGLDLIMYEGGTHAAPLDAATEDERLVAFLMAFNYSTEMAQLYQEALSAWKAIGGESFNAFVDVEQPSKWGSWGALRHLDDDSPRWQVLRSVK